MIDEPLWHLIYTGDDIERASDHWRSIVAEMREASTLSAGNAHAIKRLVDFRVIFEKSSRHVATNGPVLPARDNRASAGKRNPYWAVMRQAAETVAGLEAELGISPIRRARAAKVAKRRPAKAADLYLVKPTQK
jgi:P27 family predicted phage terminase small subunit